MSTRSTISIYKSGEKDAKGVKIGHFYRHCDGYVSGLGLELADLLNKVQQSGDQFDLLEGLNELRAEVFDGISGDAEYCYNIYHDWNCWRLTVQAGYDESKICKYTEVELASWVRGKGMTIRDCEVVEKELKEVEKNEYVDDRTDEEKLREAEVAAAYREAYLD